MSYEEWDLYLKRELENPATTKRVEITLSRLENKIKLIRDKKPGDRSASEKQQLTKHWNAIKEIDDFSSSRRYFANPNARNSLKVHVRISKRFGDHEITLYQAGDPE